MPTYLEQSHQQNINGKFLTITNITPNLSIQEEREVRTEIEQKLYDVFSKYMSHKYWKIKADMV